jgi:hypothetical protein
MVAVATIVIVRMFNFPGEAREALKLNQGHGIGADPHSVS